MAQMTRTEIPAEIEPMKDAIIPELWNAFGWGTGHPEIEPTAVCHMRYGKMRQYQDFLTPFPDLKPGETCVVKTPRGTETAVVVTPAHPIDRVTPAARVLRRPTPVDLTRRQEIASKELEERRFCQERIREHKLPMKLIEVEHLLGEERLIFHFSSESRIDFRSLVRDLAQVYHTRIEMHQIGARDQAKIAGDCGHCGLTLCCKSHLKKFQPVTTQMARDQKGTMQPEKISGHCGRLLCCLRYEYASYQETTQETAVETETEAPS
jgi:cell fate regulator YaaT (PSP1 superfamily)